MSLHDRIMALAPTTSLLVKEEVLREVTEADELMAEMADTISAMTRWINEGGSSQWNESINDICKMGESAREKYNTYKERNNEQ